MIAGDASRYVCASRETKVGQADWISRRRIEEDRGHELFHHARGEKTYRNIRTTCAVTRTAKRYRSGIKRNSKRLATWERKQRKKYASNKHPPWSSVLVVEDAVRMVMDTIHTCQNLPHNWQKQSRWCPTACQHPTACRKMRTRRSKAWRWTTCRA